MLLDAYGLPDEERQGFATHEVAERMEITASGIEALAGRGEPAFQRLVVGKYCGKPRPETNAKVTSESASR